MLNLETRGVPGVFVATVEFTDGADLQARQLGFDPAAVYVPHPIQDRTDEEMQKIADQALTRILGQLVEEA